MNLNPKNRSVSFQKRLKMFYFHHFKVFTRCRFQNVPIRVPFSKSAVFKICRQKMCLFRVNRRPIRRIFHRFQNVPASCERSLISGSVSGSYGAQSYELFRSCMRSFFSVVATSVSKIPIESILNLIMLLFPSKGDTKQLRKKKTFQ